MAQTTAKPSFGPALAIVGPHWPSLACDGPALAVVGLCWPLLACDGPVLAVTGLHWLLLAFAGLCWSLLACDGPALAIVGPHWPLLACDSPALAVIGRGWPSWAVVSHNGRGSIYTLKTLVQFKKEKRKTYQGPNDVSHRLGPCLSPCHPICRL